MSDDLQFDRVAVAGPGPDPAGATGVVCAGCRTRLETDYYQVNGKPFCGECRGRIEQLAETPRGVAPFAVAAIFGLGAAMAGAAIYYAVIALLNLEIGLVAILIGYMVGYAVRKGAGGRGGLRFQILAAVLTYCAVGLAYTPFALQGASNVPRIMALVLIPVLPVLIVVKTMPTGLITALIIFFGIRQAMRMTATPVLQISGPFRIGSAGSSSH